MYNPWSARRMPIERLSVLLPNNGPVRTIASLGIAIAAVVVVVIADMDGGGGRSGMWEGGESGLCVVLCGTSRCHTWDVSIMNVHHSTNIPKKLQILNYCTFVKHITGPFFGQSTFSKLGNFGCVFKTWYFFQSW
jgi:hypothetical protein